MAAVFMMASAVVQASQCSSGVECPSNSQAQNVVSLLQTGLQMNVFKDGGETKPAVSPTHTHKQGGTAASGKGSGAASGNGGNRPMNLAWFSHFPKTGGSAILVRMKECLKVGEGFPCSAGLARGPDGILIADFVGTGLVSPEQDVNKGQRTSLCDSKTEWLPGPIPKQIGSISFSCGDTISSAPPGRTLCNTVAQHFRAQLNRRLAVRVRQAGLQPVVIGSVRWPLSYYLSEFFYALRVQFATNFAMTGGLPRFDQSGRVCFENQESEQCVGFFRAWLRVLLTAIPTSSEHGSMTHRMFAYYGEDLEVPQQWIILERLLETTVNVLRNVTAGELTSDAKKCFSPLGSTKETKAPITGVAIKPLNKALYYDAPLLELIANADSVIFRRFNYTLCVACDQFPVHMA